MEALTTGTIGQTSVASPRQFQGLFDVIPFTVNIEEDSIAAQATSVADVTVPGAALGDFVLVTPGIDAVSVLFSGWVQAADTVTVAVTNLEVSDANTTLATVHEANGVVLKPKKNVIEWGP
jgi:hypothetical protein